MSKLPKLPALLVLREKHGDQYFFVADEDALYKAALEILTKRDKTEYYYTPSYSDPQKLDFDEAKIASMPESMQKDARAKLKKYAQDKRLYDEDMRNLEFIKQTISRKNGADAWKILKEIRGDYEYEGISIQHPLQPGEYRA